MSDLIHVPQNIAENRLDFHVFVTMVSLTLSATSARIYEQTYRAWSEYSAAQSIDASDLDPRAVAAFLQSRPTTHATRRRQLAALRAIVKLMAAVSPRHEQYLVVLERMKAPAPPIDTVQQERSKRALSASESDKLLRAF